MKASEIPWRLYCGTSQKTEIGRVDLGLSISPLAAATCSRFTSMNPATKVANIDMKKPIAMRCKKLTPCLSPVNLLAKETKMRSYKAIVASKATMVKRYIEPEGI